MARERTRAPGEIVFQWPALWRFFFFFFLYDDEDRELIFLYGNGVKSELCLLSKKSKQLRHSQRRMSMRKGLGLGEGGGGKIVPGSWVGGWGGRFGVGGRGCWKTTSSGTQKKSGWVVYQSLMSFQLVVRKPGPKSG